MFALWMLNRRRVVWEVGWLVGGWKSVNKMQVEDASMGWDVERWRKEKR
jgi:hypothetical protein